METKGTFKVSLRNLIVIIGFVGGLAGLWFGQQATITGQSARIEQIALRQDARMEAISVAQDVIKTDVATIRTQMNLIALAQQKFEIDLALLKLQVKQLEEKRP